MTYGDNDTTGGTDPPPPPQQVDSTPPESVYDPRKIDDPPKPAAEDAVGPAEKLAGMAFMFAAIGVFIALLSAGRH